MRLNANHLPTISANLSLTFCPSVKNLPHSGFGLLIGVSNLIGFKSIALDLPEGCCCIAVTILTRRTSVNVSVYNPPSGSKFVWSFALSIEIFEFVENEANGLAFTLIGDLILEAASCEDYSILVSNEVCIDIFLGNNLSLLTTFNTTQSHVFDVVLLIDPENIISVLPTRLKRAEWKKLTT